LADSGKYAGVVPEYMLSSDDEDLVKDVNALLTDYIDAMSLAKIRQGLKCMMDLSQRGNFYLQHHHIDNTLFNEQRQTCDRVIAVSINLAYLLSSLIFPFMPSTAESIWRQLNAPPRKITNVWELDIQPGHRIGKPEHLFKRIDPTMEMEWKRVFGSAHDNNNDSQQQTEKPVKGKKKKSAQ